jgi:hypothetical protein
LHARERADEVIDGVRTSEDAWLSAFTNRLHLNKLPVIYLGALRLDCIVVEAERADPSLLGIQ